MDLFNSLKDIVTNGIDLTNIPVVGDIQDQVTTATEELTGLTEGITEQTTGAVEQGQTIVEDIKNQLGL